MRTAFALLVVSLAACRAEFREVAAGLALSCGIYTNGELDCWGDGAAGLDQPPPGAFARVDVGDAFACALAENNALPQCWGFDFDGNRVPPPIPMVDVSVGAVSACAFTVDEGSPFCWGCPIDSSGGATGGPGCRPGDVDGLLQPPQLRYSDVSCGYHHCCGINAEDSTAVCWGENISGEGTPPEGSFVAISAGTRFSCALTSTGAAVCWGADDFGQASPPAGTFASISAGDRHACAVDDAGAPTCWGSDDAGQSTPPGVELRALSAGFSHTCAVDVDDAAICWGSNGVGESQPPG